MITTIKKYEKEKNIIYYTTRHVRIL